MLLPWEVEVAMLWLDAAEIAMVRCMATGQLSRVMQLAVSPLEYETVLALEGSQRKGYISI